MKTLLSLALVLFLNGCGAAPEAPVTPVEPQKLSPTPTPSVTPTPTPLGPAISFTYFSITESYSTLDQNGFVATGHCAVYLSNTYCWDDGIKMSITALPSTYHSFTFFNYGDGVPCSGSCTVDGLASPTIITSQVTATEIHHILTTGILTTTRCNAQSDGSLICPTFTLPSSAVAL